MKKIILFLLLFLTGCTSKPISETIISSPSPSPAPALAEFGNYRFAWVKLDNLANLKLLPNYNAKASSEDLIKIHHCQILVNGNFYDETDRPLGWLVSQGETLSKAITSSLFNGFLSLSTSKVESRISSSFPQGLVNLGLQSGPLLILDAKPLFLKINNDQPRRRVIVALNDQSELIFLVLTGTDSLYSGPLLADTPKLVIAIGQAIGQNLVAALNLDGGSASAFHSDTIHLNEYTYIGSFFCYNL